MNDYNEREQYYLELLTGFGLKEQEAKVYLACLKLGEEGVTEIAREAGIQRTFTYDILEELKKKGLVSVVDTSGKAKFRAISIESFQFLMEEKFDRFKAFLPELKGLEKGVNRPNVRFFEGLPGIKAVLLDTLNQPEGSEILCFSNAQGLYTKEKKLEQWYVTERVKIGISMRFIAPDNPETMEYIKQDKKQKRQTRAVPAELFPFSAEVDIYGNKVAIITLGKEMAAVILESEDIAKTFRMFFELSWRGTQGIKSA